MALNPEDLAEQALDASLADLGFAPAPRDPESEGTTYGVPWRTRVAWWAAETWGRLKGKT